MLPIGLNCYDSEQSLRTSRAQVVYARIAIEFSPPQRGECVNCVEGGVFLGVCLFSDHNVVVPGSNRSAPSIGALRLGTPTTAGPKGNPSKGPNKPCGW